jgi:hypothetical protein
MKTLHGGGQCSEHVDEEVPKRDSGSQQHSSSSPAAPLATDVQYQTQTNPMVVRAARKTVHFGDSYGDEWRDIPPASSMATQVL